MAAAICYFVFGTSLGAICLLAGLEKLRAPRGFFHGLSQYRLLPESVVPAAGGTLIAAEFVLGGLLVLGLMPVVAAIGAIVLFALFAAALAVSLARSNRAPCHCFGASEVERISPIAFLRAVALLGLAVAVLGFAVADTGGIPGDDVLPSLLMATGLVAATRLSGLFPLAWSFLRAKAEFFPTPTRRVSFRHHSLDVPLHSIQSGGELVSGVWVASYIVLWMLVLVLAFLLAGSLRQLGLIQLRLGDDPGALITDSGLERGVEAPDFAGLDSESGETVTLSDLPAVARMIVFATPSCLSCRELIPGLNEVRATRRDWDFVVVCRGDVESCQRFGRMNGLEAPMVVDTSGQIEKDYEVTLTPFAYVLDYERRVVIRGVANDWRQLESLLEQEGTLQAGREFVQMDGEPAAVSEMKEG